LHSAPAAAAAEEEEEEEGQMMTLAPHYWKGDRR
jgi:hypothetical protein